MSTLRRQLVGIRFQRDRQKDQSYRLRLASIREREPLAGIMRGFAFDAILNRYLVKRSAVRGGSRNFLLEWPKLWFRKDS